MLCSRPFIKDKEGIRRLGDREAQKDGIPLPCGRCFPCRVNKSREWQHRIMLENTQHARSCFVTLTYIPMYLPKGGNLDASDLRNFFKRLRQRIRPTKIRYFACGEYGNKNWRPHYHIALFGIGKESVDAIRKAWTHPEDGELIGKIDVGEINKNSARYIAKYVVKNMYWKNPMLDGRIPEFTRSSVGRKGSAFEGGIGAPAINEIAQKIRKDNKRLRVRELQYGKRRFHLGRYLQGKMDEALEVDNKTIEDDLNKYMDQLYVKSIEPQSLGVRIVMEGDHKRKVMRKRAKIFDRKKHL